MYDHQPTPGVAARRSRGEIYLAMLIAFCLGVLLMLLLGVGLYSQGSIWLGPIPTAVPQVCPAQQTCPTAVACPPTATALPTADLGATATSACGTFQEQFPGTPCP